MLTVETTTRRIHSLLYQPDEHVNPAPNSAVFHKCQMEVLLFDTNPIRRKDWSRLCQKRSLVLHCLDVMSDSLLAPAASCRILVFDKSVIEDSLMMGQKLISMLPYDVVAFSVQRCSVPTATRLMKLGARWVFDNELFADELEAGISALLHDAEELNEKLSSYKRVQSLRAGISPGERAVMDLVIRGIPNKTIAAQLDISTRTVEARRARVYRKCGVQSVTELVRFVDRAEELQRQFSSWAISHEAPPTY